MSKIIKQDSNGVKPLLAVGEFGYDNYPEGGDIGRVYVGNGSENIPQAKKAEVVTVDGKVDTHVARIDNPHGVTKTQVGLSNVDNTADSAKVVASAGKWTTARTLSLTGGITGSVSIDGSGNASIVTTVAANSVALGTDTTGNYVAGTTAGAGVTVSGTPGEGWSPTIALTDVGTVGTYTKVTTNSKGQITVGGTLVAEDIPNLDTSKITTGTLPVDRGGTGATTVTGTGSVVLNTSPALVTPNIGIAIGTSFNSITGLASVAPLVAGTAAVGTSTLTARQDHVHPVQTTISGNAGTATKLATARTINGVSFDGSANITVVDSTKAPLASPTFTGTPIAPTAAADTSTTQLATTAFAIPRVTGVDNAIVRFDGTTGKVQTSTLTIDDSGNIGSGTQSFNGFGGSGFKNYITNGNFDVWQYATSQTTSGYGSDDRWANYNTISTKTHSQVACTDTERALFNATYFSRTVATYVSGTGSVVKKTQMIEDITRLADKTVTLSFWARANSNKKMNIQVVDYYGVGGTPSANATSILNFGNVDLTSTWTKYKLTATLPSLIGKTLGTNGVQTSAFRLDFGFTFSADRDEVVSYGMPVGQSGTFDIAQVQLEEGSVATPFENRPYGLELSLCQRYYQNIFVFNNIIANQWIRQTVYLPVSMRTVPTLSNFEVSVGGTYYTCSLYLQTNSTNSFSIISSGGTIGGDLVLITSASAEL